VGDDVHLAEALTAGERYRDLRSAVEKDRPFSMPSMPPSLVSGRSARQRLPSPLPASNSAGGERMRKYPATQGKGGARRALIRCLAGECMRRHAGRIALAFLVMGVAAGSTAARAWLMEPVLDRIIVARDGSLLLLITGAALDLALVKGLADYGGC
jgi:hypothetical protein